MSGNKSVKKKFHMHFVTYINILFSIFLPVSLLLSTMHTYIHVGLDF